MKLNSTQWAGLGRVAKREQEHGYAGISEVDLIHGAIAAVVKRSDQMHRKDTDYSVLGIGGFLHPEGE